MMLKIVMYVHDMALTFALKNWKPRDIAVFTGVSPALQRQWRAHEFMGPLEGAGRARYDIRGVSYLWAARALIDAGIGYKRVAAPLNRLAMQIELRAIRVGLVDINGPIPADEAHAFRQNHAAHHMGGMLLRYFACKPLAEPGVDTMVDFMGEDFPKIADWLARGGGSSRGAALVFDVWALTDELLSAIDAPIIEIWDPDRLPDTPKTAKARKALERSERQLEETRAETREVLRQLKASLPANEWQEIADRFVAEGAGDLLPGEGGE